MWRMQLFHLRLVWSVRGGPDLVIHDLDIFFVSDRFLLVLKNESMQKVIQFLHLKTKLYLVWHMASLMCQENKIITEL